MSEGAESGSCGGFALIVVLFILLIIIGASYMGGGGFALIVVLFILLIYNRCGLLELMISQGKLSGKNLLF